MSSLPSWQMVLVAYAIGYFLRHKCPFLMGRFQWLDRMLECHFCIGGHGGWLAWLLAAGMAGVWPSVSLWGNLLSVLTWALSGAACTILVEDVVKWEAT